MKVLIIGAGPAGEAAAKTIRRLSRSAVPAGASKGADADVSITLVEKEFAGGLCLNKGCVPSKTLLERVHTLSSAGRPVSWAEIQKAKEEVVSTVRSQLESSLRSAQVDLVKGSASFTSASSVDVASSQGTKRFEFDRAIIATGTDAVFPPPLDAHRAELLDSDKMLMISSTPKSIVVVGGGAVGCEFACLLNAAGSHVTIIELTEGLLPGEDPGIVTALTRSFEARGITVKANTRVNTIKKYSGGWSLGLSDNSTIESEKVLVCVGRSPALDSLSLASAGIQTDRRGLILDDRLQTTNPRVFAAGDAATTRLAHAASAQAEIAASNALGMNLRYDDRFVPRCLYSWPEVASVGQWKHKLDAENRPARASRGFFRGSAKALAAREADGFVQIVSDPESGRILGAQIIGPHATELIHVFSVALKKEMTLAELGDVMFAHPTLSEVIRDAARK
jgi:dihydrolipoamide dehydrogenase